MSRFIAAALWAGLIVPLYAQDFAQLDTVDVSGGGHIDGSVVSKKETGVVMKLDNEISLFLPDARVGQIKKSENLAAYRQLASAAGDHSDKHYKLSLWCSEQGLSAQRRFHLQQTIALDTNHAKARAALGYVQDKDSGGWILFTEQQRRRGLIQAKGHGWQLPEVVARRSAQEAADVAAKKWIKELSQLLRIVARKNTKSAEALQKIKAIKDPLAASAVAAQLNDSRGTNSHSQSLRLTWVRLLGSFKNTVAVKALVLCGVEEQDAVVREAALEELQKYGASSAVATYLPMLNPEKYSNKIIRNALRALSFFPDRELAMKYIDALVTTHTRKSSTGSGINAGMTNGQAGLGGLGMGNKTKVFKETVRNPGALTLLKMITDDGTDFNYDQQSWREYFASQLTAYSGDLRRDL